MKKSLIILLLLSSVTFYGQSVAINTDGSQADPTAMLDIKSKVVVGRKTVKSTWTEPV
jgi:hypothetical protein